MAATTQVVVLGAGAVGAFYGGKLAQAGLMVSVIARSDYTQVTGHGYNIKSIWGDFDFHPEQVFSSSAECTLSPDFVLVATKVLPTIDRVNLIRPLLAKHTCIVLLQNGVNIEAPIQDAFPDHQIISGLAFVCANRIAAGKIHHLDYGRVVLGLYPAGYSAQSQLLVDAFERVGVPAHNSHTIVYDRWIKLVWNAPYNPLSVLGGGVDTQQIMALPDVVVVVEKVMWEVLKIAAACGYSLPHEVVKRNLEDTFKMKPYRTSMLLDWEQKRPLEVEAILGNALALARQHHLDCPYMQNMYALLTLMDLSNRV